MEQNRVSYVLSYYSKLEGRPLLSRQVVNLIGNTTTDKGSQIMAKLDENHYKSGIKVTDD